MSNNESSDTSDEEYVPNEVSETESDEVEPSHESDLEDFKAADSVDRGAKAAVSAADRETNEKALWEAFKTEVEHEQNNAERSSKKSSVPKGPFDGGNNADDSVVDNAADTMNVAGTVPVAEGAVIAGCDGLQSSSCLKSPALSTSEVQSARPVAMAATTPMNQKSLPQKRAGPLSLANVLLGGASKGKKPKMNMLEKSKEDWEKFVGEEGIRDDLKIFNRGKQGFLERKAFEARTEHKQFELERSIRLNSNRTKK